MLLTLLRNEISNKKREKYLKYLKRTWEKGKRCQYFCCKMIMLMCSIQIIKPFFTNNAACCQSKLDRILNIEKRDLSKFVQL